MGNRTSGQIEAGLHGARLHGARSHGAGLSDSPTSRYRLLEAVQDGHRPGRARCPLSAARCPRHRSGSFLSSATPGSWSWSVERRSRGVSLGALADLAKIESRPGRAVVRAVIEEPEPGRVPRAAPPPGRAMAMRSARRLETLLPAPSSDGSPAAGDRPRGDDGDPPHCDAAARALYQLGHGETGPTRFLAHPLPADTVVVTEIATVRKILGHLAVAHQYRRDAGQPGAVSTREHDRKVRMLTSAEDAAVAICTAIEAVLTPIEMETRS